MRGLALVSLLTLPLASLADEARYPAGAATFQANCAVCHRANGAGNPGLAPPLTVDVPRFAQSEAGRRQLVMTALYGMYGEITVGDRRYNFKMPEFSRFEDGQIAEVINHVLFDLAHVEATVTPIAASDVTSERAKPVDGAAVRAHRATVATTP